MKKYTIGIVDDERTYQVALTKQLQDREDVNSILYYSNGEELIDYIKKTISKPENQPDILFLDIHMPVMNGWEFIQEYKNLKEYLQKSIHIYILTSSTLPADYKQFVDTKIAVDFLKKPMSMEGLREVVNGVFTIKI